MALTHQTSFESKTFRGRGVALAQEGDAVNQSVHFVAPDDARRVLSDATRRQLQRLRFLLEEALSQTQDATEVGRHSALVLLDGGCEYAMGMSLGYLGKPIPREFRKKFDELRTALPAWTVQPGRDEVETSGRSAQRLTTVEQRSIRRGRVRFTDSALAENGGARHTGISGV